MVYDLAWCLIDLDAVDLHRIIEYIRWPMLWLLIRNRLELRRCSKLIQKAWIVLYIYYGTHIGIYASHALRMTAGVQTDLVIDVNWPVMVIIWISYLFFFCLRYALNRSNHRPEYGSRGLALRTFSLMRSSRFFWISSSILYIHLLYLLVLLWIIILILINGLHSLALRRLDIWMSNNRPGEAWSLCVWVIGHWVFAFVLGVSIRVSGLSDRFIDAHEARNIS